MKELEILKKIEEKVEQYYINLAQLEVDGEYDSQDYNYYLKLIVDITNEEKRLLASLNREKLLKMLKQIKKENFNKNNSKPIALGFLVNAYYYRIINMLELQLGDELFDYANILRADLNQILFSFLEYMINNEYYQDIRQDLIYYKYNQIFLNVNSEYDFIITKDISTIKLETNNYRTDDLPSYEFVDKVILVLESIDNLSFVTTANDDFLESNNDYARLVISIINILARFMLCENDMLDMVYDDLTYLLEDEYIKENIKNLIRGMLGILESLKNRIKWAR